MSNSQITRLSGLAITPSTSNKNNGFYLPLLTTAQIAAIPVNTMRNGGLFYNTTTNFINARINGVTVNLVTSIVGVATGVGLVAGSSPLVLPTGTRAAVEVAANQVAGFIYYDSTNNVVRLRNNAAWISIATV